MNWVLKKRVRRESSRYGAFYTTRCGVTRPDIAVKLSHTPSRSDGSQPRAFVSSQRAEESISDRVVQSAEYDKISDLGMPVVPIADKLADNHHIRPRFRWP